MDTTILEKVKAAIEASATVDELQVLTSQLRAQGYELRTRHQEIIPDGQTRRYVAQSGDLPALEKLDAECLKLGPQIDIITGVQERLAAALMVAKAKEGANGMTDNYKGLGACLDVEQAALRVLDQARRATDGQLDAMTQARMDIARAANISGVRFEAPAADPALLVRYIETRGIRAEPGNGWGRNTHTVERASDALGLNPPRVSQAA